MEIMVNNKKPEIRFLKAMKDVLYDKKWLKSAPNLELYYMYRKIKEKNGLRYDITIIPPLMLGKEFVKTKGHEHLKNEPELYNVLQGKAIFLFQKRKGNSIKDVYAIPAKKGETVIVPSGYGHTTINSSKKNLKMGNWIYKNCKNNYSPIEKRKGFCYFYTKSGWIKNKNYKNVPEIRFEKPGKSMPKNLAFLKGK
jgi:glucose-6-phosphate isomerase